MSRPRARRAALFVALSVGLLGAPSAALAAEDPVPGDHLKHDLAIDLPVTFVIGSLWLSSQLLQSALTSEACRWCDRDRDGADTLNALDKGSRTAFQWSSPVMADAVSDVLGWAVAPAASIGLPALAAGLEGRLDEAPTNILITLEASFGAALLSQITKFLIARERPFVHVLPADAKKRTAKPADNNVSFYSAHTNFAFAMAVSSGTLATMRGYRGAPWVWASGLGLATTIGYLRVAAGKHYMSDVLVGAAVGSLVGFVVPFVFHRKSEATESTGAALSALSASSPFSSRASAVTFAWSF